MEQAEREEDADEEAKRAEKAPKPRREKAPAPAQDGAEALGKFLKSRQGKSLQRQVMRGVFGMLKKRL